MDSTNIRPCKDKQGEPKRTNFPPLLLFALLTLLLTYTISLFASTSSLTVQQAFGASVTLSHQKRQHHTRLNISLSLDNNFCDHTVNITRAR